MQVAKWGNSLAVRLPASVVQELGLKAGDDINIRVEKAREFVVERERSREELLEEMRRISTPLPPGFKFDREEANAR